MRLHYSKCRILIDDLMIMAKHLFLLTIVFSFHLKSIGQKTVSDTTFISRDTLGGIYHAIYIEKNKNSKIYDRITNFKFDHNDTISYNESIKYFYGDKQLKFTKYKIASTLPRQWCSLHNYKDRFYLYAPSDWGNNSNLIISDTTIIQFNMDGPYARIIDSCKTIDANTFEFTIKSNSTTVKKITIHVIDWEKQIAVFDNHAENEAYRYTLMVSASEAREFPIVVNYCKVSKQREFKFDKTNFQELLVKKK